MTCQYLLTVVTLVVFIIFLVFHAFYFIFAAFWGSNTGPCAWEASALPWNHILNFLLFLYFIFFFFVPKVVIDLKRC